ncbi:MAG TPA: DUF1326 domain-containing protein [Tepidisphaeraceae bacterium]|jgi:hypothetical protein
MNIALLLASFFTFAGAGAQTKAIIPLSGDYVEARTASVFAGPCHYNGELVTTGNDAVMAWQFNTGSWRHTSLAGVCVMAAVTSTENLGQTTGSRTSEIVIDSAATPEQAQAALQVILSRSGKSLGAIASVRRGSISFQRDNRDYHIKASGFAALDISGMPNDECCKQPNLVWYSPLTNLVNRKVGYTSNAEYVAGKITEPWERSDENSAFYGAFVY